MPNSKKAPTRTSGDVAPYYPEARDDGSNPNPNPNSNFNPNPNANPNPNPSPNPTQELRDDGFTAACITAGKVEDIEFPVEAGARF